MAQVDYEKRTSGKRFTLWRDKRNGDMVRAVHNGKLFFYDVRDRDRFVIFEADAKSKTDAINKAKLYMRLH